MAERVATSMAIVLVTLTLVSASAASIQPAPRLEGSWAVSLRFTVAEGLRDRRVGERVLERWLLIPRCVRGPCDVQLRRSGRTVRLRRDGSAYRGASSFSGSTTCGGRTYARGAVYVESWIVRVVKSSPGPRGRRATRIEGIGATVGRTRESVPCAAIASREGVALTGTPRR